MQINMADCSVQHSAKILWRSGEFQLSLISTTLTSGSLSVLMP